MATRSRNENPPGIRTRFNARSFILIAMSILLCAGIAGCEADPGALVPGFGTGGVVISDPSTGSDEAHSIAIDSTAMYVVGHDDSPEEWYDCQWRIEKRTLADGSLVTEFGSGGVVTSNPGIGWEKALGIAIDSTAMYVVGFDESPGDPQWRIEKRTLADGSLVSGFGTDGVVTSNPTTGYDIAYSIAIDSDAMYVVGFDYSPGSNCQWRIEKRSLADGSLVSGFGTDGVVTSNPSTGRDVAQGIAIDSTAMYVVGFDESPEFEYAQWRIEKRSLTDGSLVPEFGTGGVVTSNSGVGIGEAWDIVIDSTAMYVVGEDWSPGNAQWQIEKRSLTDGSLIPGFGTGGVVTSDPSTGRDVANSIAIDSTAMYVVGRDESPGNDQWRIEKRSLTDGSPVPGFGAGGIVTSDPSTSWDQAQGIAIDSNAMYVIGLDHSPGNEQWRIEKRFK